MRSAGSRFSQHPRRVIAAAIVLTLAVWGVCLCSIASQIGHPFPGLLYAADRLVSALAPEHFSDPQAGVRLSDYIVAVNGQPWQEMSNHGRQCARPGHPPEADHSGGERE